jgi:hypothetical protein
MNSTAFYSAFLSLVRAVARILYISFADKWSFFSFYLTITGLFTYPYGFDHSAILDITSILLLGTYLPEITSSSSSASSSNA